MRALVNSITLLRVPIIVALALVVSPDNAELACVLYGIGLLSHGLDGVLVKYLGLARAKPGVWHEVDTAWFSLGLQLGAGVWLVRADLLPWWVLIAYPVVVFAIETGYVAPRKKAGQSFVPVILICSGPVWLAIALLIGSQAGVSEAAEARGRN